LFPYTTLFRSMAEGDGFSQPRTETTSQKVDSNEQQHVQKENETVEQMKKTSKEFWSYFTYYLKQPSHIFTKRENEFTNGILNIVVMLVLFSLSVYFLLKNFMSATMYGLEPTVDRKSTRLNSSHASISYAVFC